MDGHQMHYPSWQPPWLNIPSMADALQQQSSGTQVPARAQPTWAELHYLCFPDGLGALRELMSTLVVPVEGTQIKTRSFFI